MPQIHTDSKSIQLQEDETLLDALERTGHQVEYQCRHGYCGACRVKLLSGSVSYAEQPMVFLLPDEILPCCCQVKEDIHIAVSLKPNEGETLTGSLFDHE